ncbi:hypothetical protein [Thiomicrorhabdus sp.]|uniref:hypothetical protein n=1 Tax=Thiomicrorhabdus sp. TaxID=2039724 RepID=UPI0029C7DB45|nr:hypothetical protein [Thiomicrorhabdus sp.]
MSCCSGGYCRFEFPEGPPLVDNPVVSLNANYQFLPYGTLLEEGEVIRIWKESGETETVVLEEKIPLVFDVHGPHSRHGDAVLPWQLIALDSGFAYEDIMNWPRHPLFNAEAIPVVLRYRHPIKVKPSLKMRWLKLLYRIRNL